MDILNLTLLRHGDALPDFENDSARNLSVVGIKEVELAARSLSNTDFDVVYYSPTCRTTQTAQTFLAARSRVIPSFTAQWLRMETPLDEVLQNIAAINGSLLLIGHQPMLGCLAHWLYEGVKNDTGMSLNTGGIIQLSGYPMPGLMKNPGLNP